MSKEDSRIIKFRAWDGDKKEMHLPEYSDREDFHIMPDGTIVETHEHGYERHELTSRLPDSWVLMQFTGLKDKNGTDIYEGDEVQYEWNDSWSGEWVEKGGVVEYKNGEYYPLPNNDAIREFEVIGNLYSNPHP